MIVGDFEDLDCSDRIDVNSPVRPFRDRIVVRSEDQPVGISQVDGKLATSASRELMTADRWRRRHLTQVIRSSEQLEPELDHVGQSAETTLEFLATVTEPLQPACAEPNLQQICPVGNTITQ